MKRLSAFLAAAAGLAALFVIRRRTASAEGVDLYYEDGSMESLPPHAPQTERMLALAHQAVRAARPTP